MSTYCSASLVVVQIHFFSQVAATLARVNELAREFKAKTNIIRTAAPFPIAHAGYAAGLGIGLR